MTKTVYIIRHAKSSYALPGESDFSRPLHQTGLLEIKKTASRLKETEFSFNDILCSTALRTRQTASEFRKLLDIDEEKINYSDELYHATADVLKQTISKLDNNLNTIAIIAHNPGITNYINSCQGQYQIDDVPTCGIFGIECDCKSWSEFDSSNKNIFFFYFPGLKK